jgi:hypothetical protein
MPFLRTISALFSTRKVFLRAALICLFFVAGTAALGQSTWTGTVSTDWATAGNWTPSGVPTNATLVTIPAVPTGGRFPLVSTGTQAARDLTVAVGATVSMSGGILQIARDWKNSGTFSATAGTVQFTGASTAPNFATGTNNFFHLTINNSIDPGFDNNASSKLNVAGDFTNNNTTLVAQTASFTLTFNGTGAQAYTSLSANAIAGGVVVNKTAGTLTLSSALRTGSFTQTAGGFSTGTNQSLIATGNVAFNSGTTALNASTVTVTGTFALGGATVTGGACAVTVTGNVTNTSGTLSASTGTLTFGASFINNSANALGFGTFVFTGLLSTISGTADVILPAVSVTTGTVTLNRAATCASLTLTNNAVANSFALGSGIAFTVTGAVTINQSTATVVHAFNVDAGVAVVGGNLAFAVTTNTAGRTARVAVTTGSLTVNGNITMANTLLAANSIIDLSGGAGTLTINGGFTLTTLGTLNPGTTSTVVYGGSAAQTVLFVTGAVTYANLKIDKTGGSATTTAALTAVDLSLLQGTFSPGAAVNLSGNFLNNGGTLSGGQAFTFSGASKTISGTASTAFGAITIASGATYILSSTISATSLTFTAAGVNSSLTHASTGSMTVSGNVTINQPSTTGVTSSWNVNAATVTVTGDLSIGGTATQTRIAKLVITSGIFTVNNITFNSTSGGAANSVVDMSGGAGLVNIKGAATLPSGGGTFTPGTTGTVNFNGSAAQTVGIASLITFNNLTFNNAAGVTLSTAFGATTVKGNITVQSGLLSNGGFAIAMATSKAFTVADGATFRLTGTSGMVTGTTITKTFGPTSTVAYTGNAQTVSAEIYGHLQVSGTTGAVIKTFPGTAFEVAGDFTSSLGTATSVSFTAASAITFWGAVTIGASTTFNGGSVTVTVAGNWTNNGTFTGSAGTVIMDGVNTVIAGTGTHTFNNLTFSATGITSAVTTLTVTGNLASPDGAFTHTVGTLTMSGAAKTISGIGIVLNNLTISGSVTSTADFTVAGNLAVNAAATFTSTAGKLTMSGTSKTISNSGTLTLFDLSVTGSVTTASSFSISSLLDAGGTFTASAGTITFTSTSLFSGTANLFNVTINGTSLQLASGAVLGIANLFTITAGTLNANTTTPNTILFNGAAQSIPSASYYHIVFAGTGIKTAAGALTVNGDLTISSGATLAAGTFTHTIYGNWTNSGTFTASTGTVVFAGSNNTTLTGATTFAILTINKTSAAVTHTLASNVSAATVNMTAGSIATGSNTLTITTTRTGTGIILGNIQRTHAFATGIAYEFEGPYNTITFTSPSSITSVTVNATSGSVADFPFGGSINRSYLVTIPSGTYASAILRLHYEDAELNGNTESAMQLWKHNGTSWVLSGKTSNDVTLNYVEQTGLTSIAGRWTFSDDNNVLRWNGVTSTDWATASNWTAVQGSPSGVPTITDIVQIGTTTFTNQPSISSAASAKSIDLGSAKAVVLTVASGGSLNVQGNVGGTWSGNATHAINTGAQSVTITGNLVLSDGTANHLINLTMGAGTVTVQGGLTQSGGAGITFTGAGSLAIGSDFTYTSGTFTPSTGTVTYNGTGAQVVGGVSYYNLTINKISGTATIGSTTTIGGNLTVTAGQLTLNASTTVTGNVSIASAGTLNGGAITATVGGNWANAGTFTPASGSVNFAGTGAQSISASTFNNLIINKASGTATLTGNAAILSNLSVTAGTLDIGSFTANRSVTGGTLTISNGAALSLSGTAFPSNYSTYTLGATSTVTYNGLGAQSISAISYGHLVLTNGFTGKSLTGTTTVNGNLTISSGATLLGSSFTLNLYGDWLNSGTFTANTSTISLRGTTKVVTGTTTFYNLSVFGTYSVSGTDVTVANTASIPLGGMLAGGSGTMTFSGNVIDAGTLTSTGTTTFTGAVSQTLQFTGTALNLATVNFNGTVAPVLTSTNAPTYATVTINNTGGVTPSIGWTISTSFTVALGATFNGSSVNHTFNGSFTNNGAVTTSGTLTFSPTGAQTIKLAGSSFSSTGTLVFGGTGLLSVTGTPTALNHITIANATGVTPASGWTIGGDLTINSGAIFNAGSLSFTVAQNLTSNGTLNGGTSTFTLTGTGAQLAGSTNTTFYDLVISGSIIGADDFNVARNFTNNGSYSGTGTIVNFTGTVNSTISGTASPFAIAGMNVQKQLGVSVILFHNLTGVEQLSISSGTLETGTFTISQATGGTLAISDNATLKLGGTNTLPTFTTYALTTQSTVEYAGTTQAISTVTPYGNLTISATGTKSLAANVDVRGNFLMTAGTFTPGSAVINLGGNWIMTAGIFTSATSTVYLNGTSGQALSSTGTFNGITVDKPSGDVILASEISVRTLVFTKGKITTGANKVTILSGGSVTGASQLTGWVNGNLQKYVSTTTGAFEVGGGNFYSPVNYTLAAITTPGSLMAKATEGSHPAISGTDFINYIQRYWTITKPGVDSVVYTTATFTFTWDESDNYNPIDPVLEEVAIYDGSTWSFPTLSGTPTTSSNTITGVSRVGDFAIGEKCNVATGFSYSGTPYCSSGGTATITLAASASTGTFTSAAGLSLNASTGAVNLAGSTPGTYTVTNTKTGNGGCVSTSTASITITAAPSATISYTGTPFCSTVATASVTRTGTAGGTYASTAGLTLNAATGLITIGTSTAGTYTITYTVAAASGCAQFQTTTSVTIVTAGVWTGASSTAWSTAGNWSCGSVPTSAINVLIPTGLTNYPVLSSGTGTVNNLTIQAGATLTVSGAALQVSGTLANSGTVTATSGTFELTGTSAQSIPAAFFATNTVKSLTINNTAGVTLGGTLNLTDALTITSGALTTGGFLRLKSSATANARVAPITSNAATPVIGNVIVERYIPGRRKFRLITSSVTTSPSATLLAGQESLSIWGNWQSGGGSVSNIGTLITGGTGGDGFDQQTTNTSLYTYDDINRQYRPYSSANGKNTKYTPLKAGVAYYMFVYGDRLNPVNAAGPNSTVISATGTLLTGDQAYTSSSANPLSNVTGRYTMLGNPFASPIDWSTIPRTNLANTFWGWDPNLSATGGYVTVSSSGTITLIAPFTGSVGLNQYIQPGQGFFVRTTDVSPTMTIREQDKVSNFNPNAFRVQANSIPLMAVNLLYGDAGSQVMTDGAVLAFDPSFRKDVSREDASKLIGNAESVGFTTGTELLSIDGRPLPAENDTVQLHLGHLTRQKYTLQVFGSALDTAHLQPYLEDKYLKTIVPLVLNDTNWIDFEVVPGNAASSDSARFRLLFKSTASNGVTVHLTATKQAAIVKLDWQISAEAGIQKYRLERSANGIDFTQLTEVFATGASTYGYLDNNPLSGKNYYRVLPVYGNGTSFASGLVLVNMDLVAPVVTVFPNPVRGMNFTLRVTNLPGGRYHLAVFAGDGKRVYGETLEHTAGLFTRSVDLRTKLPAGIYYLRLESESGIYQQKIVIQ